MAIAPRPNHDGMARQIIYTRHTMYIKQYDASWDPGKPFDKSILTSSNFGENSIDISI
jgi:hypothetical protein